MTTTVITMGSLCGIRSVAVVEQAEPAQKVVVLVTAPGPRVEHRLEAAKETGLVSPLG